MVFWGTIFLALVSNASVAVASKDVVKLSGRVLGKFPEANGKFFCDKLKSSGLDTIQQLQLRSFLQSIDDSIDSSLFNEIDHDQ